ncbi:MAG TPA: hypothetical protein VNG93_00675 [Candidatus Dormibacteraeota bacterium]|nr:hypothetical protein [Candidatus Dormibacteraeota bacterium]
MWEGGGRVAGRAQQAAALERDSDRDHRRRLGERLRLPKEPLTPGEVVAKAFEPGQLGQDLGAAGRFWLFPEPRTESGLGRSQVGEVPERPQAISH